MRSAPLPERRPGTEIEYNLLHMPAAHPPYTSHHSGENFVHVVGGSGVGKDTVLAAVEQRYPEFVRFPRTVSRDLRPGEREGLDNFFLTKAEMRRRAHRFVAMSRYPGNGHMYGLDGVLLDDRLTEDSVVVCPGAIEFIPSIRQSYPAFTSVYLAPPSLDALYRRLLRRDGASRATDARFLAGSADFAAAILHRKEFDHWIVNDDLGEATTQFEAILRAIR